MEVAYCVQVNGVDVTSARHDEVIRLLTSNTCAEFTIVVYRDPSHPLSPSISPPSQLFVPSQPPVNLVSDPLNFPEASTVAKRPSAGPQLQVSRPPGTERSSTVGFVPRPTAADVRRSPTTPDAGKFPAASGKSPLTAVKTVTYSIGDPASAALEPPMPLMKMGPTGVSPRVPCHDGNLLLATPPAPARGSIGSGVSDLFSALEKTYHASQQGALNPVRSSYDVGARSSTLGGLGSNLDQKRRSLEVRVQIVML